jgi:UDP-glucose 4-epimerase
MVIKNCIKFVLLSLATVYRNPDYLVYDGEYLICHLNALVRTKLLAENILNDWSATNI